MSAELISPLCTDCESVAAATGAGFVWRRVLTWFGFDLENNMI